MRISRILKRSKALLKDIIDGYFINPNASFFVTATSHSRGPSFAFFHMAVFQKLLMCWLIELCHFSLWHVHITMPTDSLRQMNVFLGMDFSSSSVSNSDTCILLSLLFIAFSFFLHYSCCISVLPTVLITLPFCNSHIQQPRTVPCHHR